MSWKTAAQASSKLVSKMANAPFDYARTSIVCVFSIVVTLWGLTSVQSQGTTGYPSVTAELLKTCKAGKSQTENERTAKDIACSIYSGIEANS